MRLLRLHTSNDDGIFDNTFNAEIKIRKNTQIALKNISFAPTADRIIVDGDNNTVTSRLKNDRKAKITTSDTTYSKDNYTVLLDNLQYALNRMTQFGPDAGSGSTAPYERGLMYKVHAKDEFVNVDARMANQNFSLGIDRPVVTDRVVNLNNVKLGTSPNDHVINSILAQANDKDGSMCATWDIPWTKGSGWMSCSVISVDDVVDSNDQSGFIMGLINRANLDKGTLNPEDYTLGIHVKGKKTAAGSTLEVIDVVVNGVVVTHHGPLDMDGSDNLKSNFISIECQKANVVMKLYKGDTNTDARVLFDQNVDTNTRRVTTDLFPAYTFYSATPTVITGINYFTPDVYQYNGKDAVYAWLSAEMFEGDDPHPLPRPPTEHVFSADGEYKYSDLATTGATLQNDGHIDASDPDFTADVSQVPGESERTEVDYYYIIPTLGITTPTLGSTIPVIGNQYVSYRFKEIVHHVQYLEESVPYTVTITVEDLDEQTGAQIYTDAAGTLHLLESVKVYANNIEIGSISAVRGAGQTQTVTQKFFNVNTDANGVIKIEMSQAFGWSKPTTTGVHTAPAAQSGIRVNTIKVDRFGGIGDDSPYLPNLCKSSAMCWRHLMMCTCVSDRARSLISRVFPKSPNAYPQTGPTACRVRMHKSEQELRGVSRNIHISALQLATRRKVSALKWGKYR